MQTLKTLMHARWVNIGSGIVLGFVWVFFVMRHFRAYTETGHFVFLFFAFSETLQAGFFVFRSIPKSVSVIPFDWMVAVGGTFAPLFFRPGGAVIWPEAEVFVTLGMMLQIFGLLSLNRSFAIVAAKREIKTYGPYAFVRHPMYASYLFIYSGYVLFNASLANILLWFLAVAFLFLRIESEEAHLSKDEQYRSYMSRVRFRLLPFIY